MDELKACPFCGGKAKFNQAFNGCIPGISKTVFYSCEQCESNSSAITGRCENQEELFALAEKAAATWNRRADDAALAQLARESVKRELKLAKLEAEVARWAQAEADGLLAVLPCKPTGAYWHRNYDTGQLELNFEMHELREHDDTYPEIDSCAYWE